MRLFHCAVSSTFVLAFAAGMGLSLEKVSAQDDEFVPPALIKRMAEEKAARKACKVQICKAFQKPTSGPISCNITKTLLRRDILERVVGGSYTWGYGHTQCRFKLAIDAASLSQALTQESGKVSVPEHALACDVDAKDPVKGRAFSIKVFITPDVSFTKGKATAASISPVRTEGSSIASAAITSIMALDKVTGLVSRVIADEVNEFVYSKCTEEGVEVAAK